MAWVALYFAFPRPGVQESTEHLSSNPRAARNSSSILPAASRVDIEWLHVADTEGCQPLRSPQVTQNCHVSSPTRHLCGVHHPFGSEESRSSGRESLPITGRDHRFLNSSSHVVFGSRRKRLNSSGLHLIAVFLYMLVPNAGQ